MSLPANLDAVVARRLRDAGRPTETVERVSASLSGTEITYRVRFEQAGPDDRKFVTALAPDSADGIRTVLATGADVGLPETYLLDGDPVLVVMAPARGRALSRLLPLALLPGLWWRLGDGLTAGFRQLGTYLGRLHTETASESRPVASMEQYDKELRVDAALADVLGSETFDALVQALERGRTIETLEAQIHGDSTPHNVYYANGDVDLIDPGFSAGPALKDVYVTEQGIELMVGRLPYGRRSQRDRLLESFRGGYRQSAPEVTLSRADRAALRAGTYNALLARFLTVPPKTWRARATKRFDVPILRSRIRDAATTAIDDAA